MSPRHVRHFNNYLIGKCIYLVRDKISTYFTQYHKTEVKPLKVLTEHGYDITRFLTGRSNLTKFSYLFLTSFCEYGFSFIEARRFLLTVRKLDSVKSQGTKIVLKKDAGIQVNACPPPPEPMEVVSDKSQDYVAKMSAPNSHPAYSLDYRSTRMAALFSDQRIFSMALKLAATSIRNFRFQETRLQLFMALKAEGFGVDVLQHFRAYLEQTVPEVVTPKGLGIVVSDLARQYGWLPPGTSNEILSFAGIVLVEPDIMFKTVVLV